MDEEGTRWLLKADSVHSELQTSAEVISAEIYRDLGYKVPDTVIIEHNGKRYSASRSLGDGHSQSAYLADMNTSEFRQLKVFAAYLADWDRLSGGANNFKIGDDGFAIFDFGGTLGSRAQGDFKPGKVFSEATGSFTYGNFDEIYDSYRIDQLPKNHPWKNLNRRDALEAISRLQKVTPYRIRQIVKQAKYTNSTDAERMIEALIIRRHALMNYLLGRFPLTSATEIAGVSARSPALLVTRVRKEISATKDYQDYMLQNPVIRRGFAQPGVTDIEMTRYLLGNREFEMRSRAYSKLLGENRKLGMTADEAAELTDQQVAAAALEELDAIGPEGYVENHHYLFSQSTTAMSFGNAADRQPVSYSMIYSADETGKNVAQPFVVEAKTEDVLGIPHLRTAEYVGISHVRGDQVAGAYFGYPVAGKKPQNLERGSVHWYHLSVIRKDGLPVSLAIKEVETTSTTQLKTGKTIAEIDLISPKKRAHQAHKLINEHPQLESVVQTVNETLK